MGSTEPTRQQRLDDVRVLVDFLEAHPDVPIGNNGPAEFCVSASNDAEGMATLYAIAVALDGDLTHNPDSTHHFATRQFGTAVYRAFYCTRESMRQYSKDVEWIRQRREQRASAES